MRKAIIREIARFNRAPEYQVELWDRHLVDYSSGIRTYSGLLLKPPDLLKNIVAGSTAIASAVG